MSITVLRAFERLLESGPSESRIDVFFKELGSDVSEILQEYRQAVAKENGLLRDQLQFLSDLYTKGIHIDRRDGSRVAFIYFSTVLDPLVTALVRSRLCRMNANSIYLYDHQYMNFAFGVRHFGTTVRQTDVALMQYFDDWGVNKIITIGYSAAGFAAINRALALNAYASVTFSPFTTFADKHYQQDGRGNAIIDRFKKLAPDLLIDLVPLLARRDPALKLVCFYARGIPKDVWQAERVRGLPDTYALAVDLETHAILGHLIVVGTFDILMQQLAGGATVEDSVALILSRFAPKSALSSAGQKPT